MKKRIKIWIRRYGPAEIIAVFGALIGGTVINILSHNALLTALGGTLSKLVRNLLLEFGPAEYLDSFVIRPFYMYIFPKIFNNLVLGLIIGKFAADITFYIPTIISFELKNKFLKD